jgi:VWFA-related protein
MPRRSLLALFLAALAAAVVAAQQQPDEPPAVSFRVEVNYVEVDAFVTDEQGRVITNLTADDFEVLEDGKPQKVTAFSNVSIPIERPERPLFAGRVIPADVQTNREVEGRIYLIVLDDQHTDPRRAPRVKAAMRRFIEESFGTNDLAAVVYTSGRPNDSQDFTNNPQLLIASIDKFSGRKFRSATLEQLEAGRVDATGEFAAGVDPVEQERAHRARTVMRTIRQLAEFMAGARGRRKTMLLVGEGVDYDIHQAMGQGGNTASAVLADTHEAMAAATRGNVTIYTVDPRGILDGTEDLIETATTTDTVGRASLQNELRLSQSSLRALADETGGFASLNQNDFDRAFRRIVEENSSYYLLGFYSENQRREGRYRKLDVRVKRPGLRVRARTGYYEARGRRPASQPLRTSGDALPSVVAAMDSPLPIAGFPITVFAAPFKGTAPNAEVALVIEVDGNALDFVEKNGVFAEKLEVAHSAVSIAGRRVPGDRHTMNLNLKPDTLKRVRGGGIRVLSQQTMPPGRYQIRIAAGNEGGKAGSVLHDIEVPDFHRARFSMSGVVISSANLSSMVTLAPKNPLRDFLPGPATAAREFAVGDELAIFAEFYEAADNAPPHLIDMKAELRADGGAAVRQASDQRSSTELQGKGGGYGLSARMTLADLAPGLYVLHVEGVSRAAADSPVSRDIVIRVKRGESTD